MPDTTMQTMTDPRMIGRCLVVATMAFLTVADLFAAQAILPELVRGYAVTPAAMSAAVNASTIGMAAGGLGIALFGQRLDRRRGILLSLGLLTIPTLLLATLPSPPIFTILRICQGLCMSSAFALTLALLGERATGAGSATEFAAYVTGNVASNLFGRMLSAGVASHFGLSGNFLVFAALNLVGVALVAATVRPTPSSAPITPIRAGNWTAPFAQPGLLPGFAIGFCILFAFIGTFTFVNFVLARPPLSLGMMRIGVSYLVFLPAIFTTPLAGTVQRRIGTRPALWLALLIAVIGLPALVLPSLQAVLFGMVLVSAGTFFAQALATGYIGRAAGPHKGTASGIYLASYFMGGCVGSAVLGQVFDRVGWPACVTGIAAALVAACLLTARLREPTAPAVATVSENAA
jgi:MFS transporter, YNFM family, putative membrane transport protein